jgi:hypothetical protein
MGDGLPVLLTGDVFFEKVVIYEAAQRHEAREKEDRRAEKNARKPAMEKWLEGETERKRLIGLRRAAYAAELVEWEAARVIARDTRGMKVPKKPLLALGDLSKAKPKPNANADPEDVEPEQHQHEKEDEVRRVFGSGGEEDLSSEGEDDNDNSNSP